MGMYRGKLFLQSGNTKRAIKNFNFAYSIHQLFKIYAPDEDGANEEHAYQCLFHLGMTEMSLANWKAAFEFFTNAIAIDNSKEEAFYRRALCLLRSEPIGEDQSDRAARRKNDVQS